MADALTDPFGWAALGLETEAAAALSGPTVERAAPVGAVTEAGGNAAGGNVDGSGSAVVGGTGGGPGRRRRSPSRRGAWLAAALAVLAAVVITVAVARSAGTPGSVQEPLGLTGSSAPTGSAGGPGLIASRSAASPGSQPSGSPSGSPTSSRRGSKPRPRASTPLGPKGGFTPTAAPSQTGPGLFTATASPSVSAPGSVPGPTPVSTPGSTPSATTGSTPTQPGQPTDPGSPSPSLSPSGTPSPSPPADTDWQCGSAVAATLLSSGADTGQTLQACIRINNGELELHGVLSGTVKSWHEQIILVLEDSAGDDDGDYYSDDCTRRYCTFTQSVTPPSDGEWTVLPEWARYNGNYQSTGTESGYVDF